MIPKKVYAVAEAAAEAPLTFDPEICDGCNQCVEACQVDILMPNPQKGKPPMVIYPSECWYGGCCAAICPKPGAITLNSMLRNSVHWRRKSTGED